MGARLTSLAPPGRPVTCRPDRTGCDRSRWRTSSSAASPCGRGSTPRRPCASCSTPAAPTATPSSSSTTARRPAPCQARSTASRSPPTPPPPRRSPAASSRTTGSAGDRVRIAMRNFPEWSIAFWGATAAGAVVVPLNAWWTGPELAYGLADSGSRVLIADAERAERIADHRAELPDLERVLVARAGRSPVAGTTAFEDAIGDVAGDAAAPMSRSGPRTTPRSSTRRARRGSPRARSAPTATSARTCSASATASRAAACSSQRPRRPPRARRAATSTCSRCRSSTPPAATRSSSPTWPSAGRS